MAEPTFTRCPGCKTVFRVTPEQLALRNGQVRCGHCRAVFDANAQAISLAPSAQRAFAGDDDLARGPATVTLRSSRALQVAPPVPTPAHAATPPEPSFTSPAARAPSHDVAPVAAAASSPTATPRDSERPSAEPEEPDAVRSEPWTSRAGVHALLYALAALVLVIVLGVQTLVHFRDPIAARWPAAKPLLASLCAPFGCAVRPLRDIAGLSIDASDLQADPAHKGLLILTATLRNRAAMALAYPYLELTLTDAGDRVVVRRALTPADYATGTLNYATGFPANSEILVKTFIDASATTQAGYRLYLYYP
ncbi:MAG TPA: DUF3426 domain-containing protein [Casimicrobiaceae bacterium]|nr:DUF3426 domain-containing protein [Casimicrobiaceae bacterium]